MPFLIFVYQKDRPHGPCSLGVPEFLTIYSIGWGGGRGGLWQAGRGRKGWSGMEGCREELGNGREGKGGGSGSGRRGSGVAREGCSLVGNLWIDMQLEGCFVGLFKSQL